ncbi:MAG: hypothetical protein HYR85_17445 [Planctomycetes bacterium]|nr:hypothetical protein [Planctomycetota bacterium]
MRAIGDAILPDARVEGAEGGGTDRTFDWTLLVAGNSFTKPIVLAGGLTPTNVESTIRAVCAQAVHASSGVDASTGMKDAPAMLDFVRRAKAAT